MQPPDISIPPAVNSRAWWEEYFKSTWDANGGEAQTRYFMELLIAHLPEPEREYLKRGSLKILDWGCAIGNGVASLAEAFPGNEVSGLDFSAGAIEEARLRHPGYEFMVTKDGEIPRPFDVIVTSNCLEHFGIPTGDHGKAPWRVAGMSTWCWFLIMRLTLARPAPRAVPPGIVSPTSRPFCSAGRGAKSTSITIFGQAARCWSSTAARLI